MAYTTIDDPSQYFQTDIHTGDGSGSTETFDGNSDLQPDLLWFKSRSVTGDHGWVDTSRSKPSSNNSFFILRSNSTGGDVTVNSGADFTAMNSDGYTYGNVHYLDLATNTSQNTVWGWKANGGSRTTFTESSNNPGGGYQANTTAGFSIVDYTGTGGAGTVSHGLGAEPKVLIVKNRDATTDWAVYHRNASSAGNDSYLELNTTDAVATAGTVWNDTSPSSSVFTVGTNTKTNTDGEKYIAYCFTPIQGYSKFGKYEGNGESNGTFAYTGFKPAWLMIKRNDSSTNSDWAIYDNKRSASGGGNENNKFLRANGTNTEASASGLDLLSNGFKIRSTSSRVNANNSIYVYMAFAEHPFVSSKGVPATAR
jgi:hypothetical protein